MTAAPVTTTENYAPDDHLLWYQRPVNPTPKPHNSDTAITEESN